MSLITDTFIDLLLDYAKKEINKDVYEQTKKCLIDYLGVTYAGSVLLKEKTSDYISIAGYNNKGVKAIGLNHQASLLEAAFINGLNAHVAELDDGERYGMFHPGAVVFSALIPVSQFFEISVDSFIRAAILGYEASIRLGRSLQPYLKDKGFHGTGICGIFGAAIASGVALSFSKQELKDTLSAAATFSSGLLKVIKGRSEMKPFNVANAAKNGLNAALLVKSGFTGPDDVFDGKMGFLKAFTGFFDKEMLLEERESFSIMQIYMKPYAACRHCHPAIEAALNIKRKHRLTVNSIRSVTVETYFWAVDGHEHTKIEGVSSAKMSTPFSVAVALHKDKAGINEFTDSNIDDDSIKTLTQKVSVITNDNLTALVPQKRGAIVSVETNDNEIFTERIDYPKGEPESPLTLMDIKEKFMALTQFGGLELEYSLSLYECIIDIENRFKELLNAI